MSARELVSGPGILTETLTRSSGGSTRAKTRRSVIALTDLHTYIGMMTERSLLKSGSWTGSIIALTDLQCNIGMVTERWLLKSGSWTGSIIALTGLQSELGMMTERWLPKIGG